MPEYGIDAIFALYESKCILVGSDIIRPLSNGRNL